MRNGNGLFIALIVAMSSMFICVSKEKVLFNSDMYLSDLKEAKLILSKIKERIG